MQSLTTVFRVPQALSVAPSLRSGRYNQGPSGTLKTVVPSEAAPNYYLVYPPFWHLVSLCTHLNNAVLDRIPTSQYKIGVSYVLISTSGSTSVV